MPKFQKLPLVIEAKQYKHNMKHPPNGVCFCNNVPLGGQPHVHTLEGYHIVTDEDWIITGIIGEKYPCKDEVFRATHKAIDLEGERLLGSS